MRLYIVNLKCPWNPVVERDYEVKVCAKTVWAIAKTGRRFLMGASAFQTMASAERCRLALLHQIHESSWQQWHRAHAWHSADVVLKQMQTLH